MFEEKREKEGKFEKTRRKKEEKGTEAGEELGEEFVRELFSNKNLPELTRERDRKTQVREEIFCSN